MIKKKIERFKEVLTPTEAAEYLGVSRRTVDRAAEDGKLNKYRINGGQRVFYKKEELEKLFTIED
ncbi:helix-turn-helix domain-containing protein [Brumimicrobium aurantiacum]|uniref:DNA-binding protein n=1 Tax=Brumimicrobium aurantiacum TaxID=1737063 RepID=A0A3E1EZJ3_9FLAO|nr:helix-turn-helix domain-containing protein [Brumimicrobium aurantiacum]RFC54877.1 DNA-binding protein [Brumimicrobium aurantiacum]